MQEKVAMVKMREAKREIITTHRMLCKKEDYTQ